MEFEKTLSEDENLIEVDKTSFGYSVTHKKGQRLLYTGSFSRESEAIRTATKMAKHLEVCGEAVWYCLNYAFGKKGR